MLVVKYHHLNVTLCQESFCRKVKVKVAELYPNSLWPHELYSPWILQARILQWVAFPSSRGSSQTRDWTQVSSIAGGFFTSWATGEALRIFPYIFDCIESSLHHVWSLIFIAAGKIFSCGIKLWVASSSLTRDRTQALCIGSSES